MDDLIGDESPALAAMESKDNLHDPTVALSSSLNDLSLNPSNISTTPSRLRYQHDLSKRSPNEVQETIHSPKPARRSSGISPSEKQTTSPSLTRRVSSSALRNSGTPPPFRRASSRTSSPKGAGASIQDVAEEKPALTAANVAEIYFGKEMSYHASNAGREADTIVVIHDSCYGHRFSRPKTSKGILSSIVERPERIQASMFGIASAYVRLGSRFAGHINAPHPQREPSKDMPFQIKRTSRSVSITSPVVTNVHGLKWMQELKGMCEGAETKLSIGGKEIGRINTPSQPPKQPLHEGDLYLCKDSLEAFQGALGGVLDGVDAVFAESAAGISRKKAFVCIRPPGHHCSSDLPSGFCWINNVHVGIEHAVQQYGLTHACIIDMDLHHGDGSQSIAWERNSKAFRAAKNAPTSKKTAIGYFSIHDINSYPCEDGDKEKVQNASVCLENAHGQHIWNVHLQPWETEDEFWNLYEKHYLLLLDKARAFLRTQTQRFSSMPGKCEPRAAIFVSAGFDASEWESEGMQRHGTRVPTEFFARLTSDIVTLSHEAETGVEGRIVSVLEGGYSDRALMSGVLSHLSGLVGGSAQDPSVLLGTSGKDSKDIRSSVEFDTAWWHKSALEEFENLQQPPAPVIPKKVRKTDAPTYTSPTQSFTAKVIDPSKIRSLSGTHNSVPTSRPATPPPPEVGWATAAHELGKLLIPKDRQINSCKHEELTEAKPKQRHSSIGLPSIEPPKDRRQLRERKLKPQESIMEDDAIPVLQVSQNNRRRTMSDMSILPDETVSDGRNKGLSDTRSTSADSSSHPLGNPLPMASSSSVVPELNVNKIRGTSGARMNPSTIKNSVKGSSVPKAPRRPAKATPAQNTITEDDKNDVAQLTTGIKKITLRMPKQVGQAAKDSLDTTKPKTKTPKANATVSKDTTRAENDTLTTGDLSKMEVDRMPVKAENKPDLAIGDTHEILADQNTKLALSKDEPKVNIVKAADSTPAAPSGQSNETAGFIPYNPPFEGTKNVVQGSLTWLPPNSNTPIPTPVKKERQSLPVFTAQSQIPFAAIKKPPDTVAPSVLREDTQNRWDANAEKNQTLPGISSPNAENLRSSRPQDILKDQVNP